MAETRQQPMWHSFVAGATSGLVSRVVTYPADTLKARLQVKGVVNGDVSQYCSTAAAARHIFRTEGPIGFFRGFGAILWGVLPANLAYFGGYEAGKRIMPREWGITADMATGAFAQVLAGLVYTPIDIVKERMQVQAMMHTSFVPSSPLQAFRALLQQGQGVRGVFKGYWATNAVWLPWNAFYIAGYEQLKRAWAAALHQQQHQQQTHPQLAADSFTSQQQLPPVAIASCSAAAAAAAAIVTHPFDVVKTRLQVLSADPQQAGLTALQVARHQLQREGIGSLFHGLTARLLNIAPGCALSWALYEQLKGVLDDD